MKVNVCMFVWNHFTNDARVLRECTALGEAGYGVDLIAIHDANDVGLRERESFSGNFSVYRVSGRLPRLVVCSLGGVRKVRSLLLSNVLLLVLFLIALGVAVFFYPIPAVIFLCVGALLCARRVRIVFLKSCMVLRMVRFGLGKEYDIYHANDLNTLIQGVVCSKFKVFKRNRKKLIYDSHEVQTSRMGYSSRVYDWMEKFLISFCDRVINENHTRAAYTRELYGFYPAVVHNYPFVSRPEEVEKVDLYELLDIPEEEPILLYQGGMQIGRGLDKVIEAVPLFKSGIVVFIGDGRLKAELVEKVIRMDLESRVKFVPKVPVRELIRYTPNGYLGFQVLNNVCFNHYSASSNKLFEYMMSGVPVIACSFPEIQRVVEGEKTGICVDSHCPESIARGVNYLLDHPEVRETMRRNCFKARNRYNWDNEKLKFIKVYEEIKVA